MIGDLKVNHRYVYDGRILKVVGVVDALFQDDSC